MPSSNRAPAHDLVAEEDSAFYVAGIGCRLGAAMGDGSESNLYRLWVEDIARIREMRRQTTAFFVSLNLAGYGALAFALSPSNNLPRLTALAACVAFLFVNLSWILTDRRYAKQAAAKFAFARKLEESMSHQPLANEHKVVGQPAELSWWLLMERLLPILFSIGFAGLAAIQVPWAMPFKAPGWWIWLLQR